MISRYFRMLSFLIVSCISIQSIQSFAVSSNSIYGRCLLQEETQKSTLKEYLKQLSLYEQIAHAKAEIHSPFFKTNLKWNFETTQLVYDLIVLNPLFTNLDQIYTLISKKSPESVKNLNQDLSFHHMLFAKNYEETNMRGYTLKISQVTGSEAVAQLELLNNQIKDDVIRNALYNLYGKIRNAGLSAIPTEPAMVTKLLKLSQFFISETLQRKNQSEFQPFNNLVESWMQHQSLPTLKTMVSLSSDLVPLNEFPYPQNLSKDEDIKTLVDHYVLTSIVSFLFNRELTSDEVVNWKKTNLQSFNSLLKWARSLDYIDSHLSDNEAVIELIHINHRVDDNSFDQYVWSGQSDLSTRDRAIDGIARTLYGEATLCEVSHLEQFKAIGTIIGLRTLAAAKEYQMKSRLGYILGSIDTRKDTIASNGLEDIFYRNNSGAKDFARFRDVEDNSSIFQMPLAAQVVSRPGQFSVWKVGESKDYPLSQWKIQLPQELGYPNLSKETIVINSVKSTSVDDVQNRVLCPSPRDQAIFQKAVDVATEIFDNPVLFTDKYSFRLGNKCDNSANIINPFYYTHNASLSFATPVHPIFCEDNKSLNIYGDKKTPLACRKFQLFMTNK